jgi:flagellar capping protein FliD
MRSSGCAAKCLKYDGKYRKSDHPMRPLRGEVYLLSWGNLRMVLVECVTRIMYSLAMSNPYKEEQTHMSRRRPPNATPYVEAGAHPPVNSSTHETSGYRHDAVPAWLAPILQGITLVILIGFAFWFGALGKTVEQTAKTVEELRAGKESMGNRLTAIETEVRASKESMDKRLTAVETKVESMDNRLTGIETKLSSVDRKLDRVPKRSP